MGNPIIYVGHSSEEGIRYYGRLVPWEFLANLIRNSASDAHYILGCESSKVTELTLQTGKRVFSFEQKVDAIFGANLISIMLFQSFDLRPLITLAKFISNALIRINLKTQDPNFLPLYVTGKMGQNEAIVRGVNAILLFSAIFFTLSAARLQPYFSTQWSKYVTLGMASYLIYLIFRIFNSASKGDAAGVAISLGAFISALFAFGKFVLEALSWWVYSQVAALLGADLSSTPGKMPMYPAIIIMSVAYSIAEVIKFIQDYNDNDDTPS